MATEQNQQPQPRARRAYSRDPLVQAAKDLIEAERGRRAQRHYLAQTMRETEEPLNARNARWLEYRKQGVERSEATFERVRERLVQLAREDR